MTSLTSNEELIRQKYESISHQSEEFSSNEEIHFSQQQHQQQEQQQQQNAHYKQQQQQSALPAVSNCIFSQQENLFEKYLSFGHSMYDNDLFAHNPLFGFPACNMLSMNSDLYETDHIVKQEEVNEVDDNIFEQNNPQSQLQSSQQQQQQPQQLSAIPYQLIDLKTIKVQDFCSEKELQQLQMNSSDTKMTIKMKRIMKREKAKTRTLQNAEIQKQKLKQIQAAAEVAMTQNQSNEASITPSTSTYIASTQIIQSLDASSARIIEEIEAIHTPTISSDPTGMADFQVKMEFNSTNNNNQVLQQNDTSSQCSSQSSREQSKGKEDQKLKALQQQFQSGTLDAKQQKKVMQMIRNRISAQNSRDRKKAYINKLESEQNESDSVRSNLQSAKASLESEKLKTKELQQQISALQKQLQSNRNGNKSSTSIRSKSHTSSSTKPISDDTSETNSVNNKCSQINSNNNTNNASVNNTSSHYGQKYLAAFNVAMFAFLGVVMIFNSKPTSTQQVLIDSNSQMTKMLGDLPKESQVEFGRIATESSSVAAATAPASQSNSKNAQRSVVSAESASIVNQSGEFIEIEEEEEVVHNQMIDCGVFATHSHHFEEATSIRSFDSLSDQLTMSRSQEEYSSLDNSNSVGNSKEIKAGQWISMMVKNPNHGKPMQVYAQIHSVEDLNANADSAAAAEIEIN